MQDKAYVGIDSTQEDGRGTALRCAKWKRKVKRLLDSKEL